MISLLDDIERWHRGGLGVALARIVEVEGSAPRLAGATMAVNQEGEVAGSLSGGCVESSVVDVALAVLAEQALGRLVRFDALGDPDDPVGVGLTCGGAVGVFVEPLPASLLPALVDARDHHRGVALVTMIDGPTPGAAFVVDALGGQVGSLGSPGLDAAPATEARKALDEGANRLVHEADGVVAFVHSFVAAPRMVIIGAVDFTAALVKVARVLGYRVTVCDARATFATTVRFPDADEVVVDWPHRYLDGIATSLGPRDAVCVLTHDHKYDVPALMSALSTSVGYVGAMGSRQTNAERRQRLLDAGAEEASLGRIMAPIGLDIGASTPEEVAVATCAEIVASRHARLGGPVTALRDGQGPIHRGAS
ncbi:MAG: XdhC family protein [Actinobacteria bacterium]|nr:XdhC family protein [Actinomycetota bacterium]